VDAATIAGLLADPARLKVVAALALGAGTIEEVSAASGLPLKDVALAARRLARAGLVHRDGHALALHTDRFGAAARAAAAAGPVREPLSDDPAEDAVLSAFLDTGGWSPSRRSAASGSSSSGTSCGSSSRASGIRSGRSTPCWRSGTPTSPRCAATSWTRDC
jgi:hypothetical protein